MCFLPRAQLISVWHCRGSGVRPGHVFKLLLQPTTPRAAITAINTVSPLQGFTGPQKQYSEDELCGKDASKRSRWTFSDEDTLVAGDETIISLLFTTIRQISRS